MLEKLNHAAYARQVNTEFHVHDDGAKPFALKLTQVVERTKSDRQEVFSLLFHGPAADFIPQGIHKIKHAELGEGDLFLVPVGKDNDGFEYEAVFNHLIQPKN